MLKYHELVYQIGKKIKEKLKEFEPPFIVLMNMDLVELIDNTFSFRPKKKISLWEELYMLTTFKGVRVVRDIVAHSEKQPIVLYQSRGRR